ncbi:glycoside hydrolase family 128 protein [Amniculicola lignicola CBS 123094]|uniref:Glycoside hydrolase family 128 protein n=1 Tax=Amniculicola lignicola CBS 123094 TaxID=1392246 RepID=A0A6A5W3Q4_9PLEO|nr:glycoside hydrolase family 128 protein [Amniculicola lignicola CBS 123094]
MSRGPRKFTHSKEVMLSLTLSLPAGPLASRGSIEPTRAAVYRAAYLSSISKTTQHHPTKLLQAPQLLPESLPTYAAAIGLPNLSWTSYSSMVLSVLRANSTSLTSLEKNKHGIAYEYGQHNVIRFFDDPITKVTWVYNWNSDTGPTNMGYEYNPMLWSDRPMLIGVFEVVRACVEFFRSMNRIRNGHLGAACIDLDHAVDVHRRNINVLRVKYGGKIRIGSPAVTNSAAPDGLEWLRKFIEKCGGCQIDFVNIHS